jgi:hypothetical protein
MIGYEGRFMVTDFKRSAQTAWRRIGNETIVVNLRTRRMVSLNAPGGAIWECLGVEVDLMALARAVAPDCPAAVPIIEEFMASLAREGLVDGANGEDACHRHGYGGAVPPGLVVPRITWNEELLRFGGACGKLPAQGAGCLASPRNS